MPMYREQFRRILFYVFLRHLIQLFFWQNNFVYAHATHYIQKGIVYRINNYNVINGSNFFAYCKNMKWLVSFIKEIHKRICAYEIYNRSTEKLTIRKQNIILLMGRYVRQTGKFAIRFYSMKLLPSIRHRESQFCTQVLTYLQIQPLCMLYSFLYHTYFTCLSGILSILKLNQQLTA